MIIWTKVYDPLLSIFIQVYSVSLLSIFWSLKSPFRESEPFPFQDFLCKVFLHFQGSKLIELKRLIDAAGGGRDLRHCVYSVITSEAASGIWGMGMGGGMGW